MRRYTSLMVIGMLWLVQPALAAPDDNAQRLEKAQALIDVMGMTSISQQMMDAVTTQFESSVLAQNAGREKEVHALVDDYIRPTLKEGIPELLRGMEALYATHYTVEELDQIIAFYRTPVGQKTLQLMPQIVQQSVAYGQAWAVKMLQKAHQNFAAAAKQRGLKL